MWLLLAVICCLALSGLTQVALAEEVETSSGRSFNIKNDTLEPLTVLPFDIPRQRADGALTALGQQADITVVYRLDWVKPFYTNVLKGNHTLPEAVEILLVGTGLTARLDSKGHLIISQKNDRERESMNSKNMNSKKTLLAATIGFFMGGGVQGVVAQDEVGGQEESGWALEEIVVTAQKRGEVSLQDAAVSMSVLSSETISKRGLVGMKDYLYTLPGVSYIETAPGENKIVIRGLSLAGDLQGTAGAYLGEVPMSSASRSAFDIKLVDIERIEVIRGPQGTLYGSSALGGIVRNVPVAPNLNSFEGGIELDASAMSETHDLSYSGTGVLNLPLIEDELALRVAAYHYDNSGYVDAISTPLAEAIATDTGSTVFVEDDIGSSEVTGGRGSLRWKPAEQWDVTLMLGAQEVDQRGSSFTVDLDGDRHEIAYLNNGRNETNKTQYANLLIDLGLEWGTLISSSSWVENEAVLDQNYFPLIMDSTYGPLRQDDLAETDIFSQELRFASNLGGPWEYLVGAFYEDVRREYFTEANWVGTNTQANPFEQPLLMDRLSTVDYSQQALFGELSYQFNEQWELTFGGRYFDYDRIDKVIFLTDALLGTSANNSEENMGETGQTYKANLSFTPSENTHFYAQWSEGFRLGLGQHVPPRNLCDVDNDGKLDGTEGVLTNRVEADLTNNLELGGKMIFMERRLSVNAALFQIDWVNIPVTMYDTTDQCPGTSRIINNIGEARSQGIELELHYVVNSALTLNASASALDTEWLEARPPIEEGESLIYAPEVNASLGLEYHFDWGTYQAFLRGDVSYVGEYETFNRIYDFPTGGDYVNVNLRAGIEKDNWRLSLYTTNLTNEDGLIFYDSGLENRVTPRRIGLNLRYDL